MSSWWHFFWLQLRRSGSWGSWFRFGGSQQWSADYILLKPADTTSAVLGVCESTARNPIFFCFRKKTFELFKCKKKIQISPVCGLSPYNSAHRRLAKLVKIQDAKSKTEDECESRKWSTSTQLLCRWDPHCDLSLLFDQTATFILICPAHPQSLSLSLLICFHVINNYNDEKIITNNNNVNNNNANNNDNNNCQRLSPCEGETFQRGQRWKEIIIRDSSSCHT